MAGRLRNGGGTRHNSGLSTPVSLMVSPATPAEAEPNGTTAAAAGLAAGSEGVEDEALATGSTLVGTGSSSSILTPGRLASHQHFPSGTILTRSSSPAEPDRASPSYCTRAGTDILSRARDEGARMSRSITSHSRRASSTSTTLPVVPRGQGMESLNTQILPSEDFSGEMRRALRSSHSTTAVAPSTNTHPARNAQRALSSSQEEHPLTSCPLRLPTRQAGTGGGTEGGRTSMRRLSGGGRDSWRAPAVGYNLMERRTARDTTALRAVSARLDAAATAIDAVEIGVRSAADSLDSLLQLLESRQESAITPPATGSGIGSRADQSPSSSVSASSGSEHEAVSGSLSRGRLTSSHAATTPSREVLPVVSARSGEGRRGSRAANMSRRHLLVGSGLLVSNRQTEDRANEGARSRATFSASSHGVDRSLQEPFATRDAHAGVLEEDLSDLSGSDEVLTALPPRTHTTPSVASEGSEGTISSRSIAGHIQEQERGEVDDVRRATSNVGPGGEAESVGRLTLGATAEPEVTTYAAGGQIDSASSSSHSNQASAGSRLSPHGMASGGDNPTLPFDGVETARNDSRNLEQEMVELALESIDAERSRLILEIARLRGQQNQSLAHLHRLQHEQFVVRQRQVSTLSDIVNSFGRTVEAASALPHGENSSLGRISSDVVATLRRMLRLLSATIPIAAPTRSARTTLSGTSLSERTATRPDGVLRTAREGRLAVGGSADTYSVGGRVALRPTGVDLTQEVIDAALQALPRLAAAATAISGARRMQGYVAGLEDGAPASAEERRCCSKETIDALPDALPCSGEVDGIDDGGTDGVRGCVICLSDGSMTEQLLCRLPCNHVFHRACVGKWLRMQDSCPTCRRQVPNIGAGSTATTTPVV